MCTRHDDGVRPAMGCEDFMCAKVKLSQLFDDLQPILVAVTASANPAAPPAGSQTTITGTLTNPLGTAAPTGAVTLTVLLAP